MAAQPAKPRSFTAAEQSLLDKGKSLLQQLAVEECAFSASGRIGVTIGIRNGLLEVQQVPRRYLEASRP